MDDGSGCQLGTKGGGAIAPTVVSQHSLDGDAVGGEEGPGPAPKNRRLSRLARWHGLDGRPEDIVSIANACDHVCRLAGLDHEVVDVEPSEYPELTKVFGPTLVADAEKAAQARPDRRKLEDSKTYKRLGYSPISATRDWRRRSSGSGRSARSIPDRSEDDVSHAGHSSVQSECPTASSLAASRSVSRTLQPPTRHRARWERPPLRRFWEECAAWLPGWLTTV